MKDTEDFLTAQGFRSYEQKDTDQFQRRKVLYQRRLEGVEPVCRCNDKLHLNVTLYAYEIHGKVHTSAEVDITGEQPDGEWAKLTIYSVEVEDIPAKLSNIEQRLIRAWVASCELAPADPETSEG